MPDLNLRIAGVEPAARGLVPLLQFKVRIEAPETEMAVRGMLLNAQIQIQCPQRAYSPEEKEKLSELFGPPERWGQTLRTRLWTHTQTMIGPFTGSVQATLPVQCTYDLNVASAKYFHALKDGEIPLLFLFSGTVFYSGPDGRLQVEQLSWNKESPFRMPVRLWRDLIEVHYPNQGWINLRQDVLDRLYAFRRRLGLATWERTVEHLLDLEAEPGEFSKPKEEAPA